MGNFSTIPLGETEKIANATALALAVVGDDHPLFREGVATILAGLTPPMEVRQASTFEKVLEAARADREPEMFSLDLRFPGMDLERDVPLLRAEFPASSVVIVTMSDNAASVRKIIEVGVDGFISKAVEAHALRDGLEALRRGEFVNLGGGLSLDPTTEIVQRYPDLTQRQLEVLLRVTAGKSNKEIARELEISPFTVQIHVSAMLRSLRVDGRASAAAIAAKFGL